MVGLSVVGLSMYLYFSPDEVHPVNLSSISPFLALGLFLVMTGLLGYSGAVQERPLSLYCFSFVHLISGGLIVCVSISVLLYLHALISVSQGNTDSQLERAVSDSLLGYFDGCCDMGLPDRIECSDIVTTHCVYDYNTYSKVKQTILDNDSCKGTNSHVCPDHTTEKEFEGNVVDSLSSVQAFSIGFAVLGGVLLVSFMASCCVACQRRKEYHSQQMLIGFREPLLS